ncbi:hypothetical protein BJX99DRAFT_126275 [Aspergillus californicus]
MATMQASISSLVVGCLREIGQVQQLLSSPDNQTLATLWKDELGRLRIWTANVGAHQAGLSSLEYRLRDASHIKDQIFRLVKRLHRACTDTRDVLAGILTDDELSDSGSDGANGEDEMEMIYNSIRDTINCLFQMSMVIRQPAHHDRFLGIRNSDTAHFEPYDRQHVSNKYPEAEEQIITRLARGISERRAILRYRQRHREKLAHGLDGAVADEPYTGSTKLSETVATDYIERLEEGPNLDNRSDITRTSYAQTLLHGRDGIMAVPPLPAEAADGAYFECPYCFYIITMSSMRTWACHVFNDLMPYICLFSDCPTPHRLYGSRHEWTSHTQQAHPERLLDNCGLCHSTSTSVSSMSKHLARHLEELALFALPRLETGDETASGPSKHSTRSDASFADNAEADTVDYANTAYEKAKFETMERDLCVAVARVLAEEAKDKEKEKAIARLESFIVLERTEREAREAIERVAAEEADETARKEAISRIERLVLDKRRERDRRDAVERALAEEGYKLARKEAIAGLERLILDERRERDGRDAVERALAEEGYGDVRKEAIARLERLILDERTERNRRDAVKRVAAEHYFIRP